MSVIRTERGWGGHFIYVNRCLFRRNTLLEYNNTKIVVSTVGLMIDIHAPGYPNGITFDTIGHNRYYETMAFHSKEEDIRYHDADVSRNVSFDSPWTISEIDADDLANEMHEAVVTELTSRLLSGKLI